MTTLDKRIAALEALDEGKTERKWVPNKYAGMHFISTPEGEIIAEDVAGNYAQLIAAAPEMMRVIRALKAERDAAKNVLRDLATALDEAFISSWQSTAAWKTQLDAALDFLKEKP